MTAGDYVDNSCHSIASVQRATSPFHNLYMVYVVRVYAAQVILAAVVTVQALAVNHYQDIVVAQTVQSHLAAHITCIEIKSCT